MGRRRIRHAAGLQDTTVSIWDVRKDRRVSAGQEFQAEVFDREDDFMSVGLDALFISVPPSEHEHYIQRCLDIRIPFMVEQPISYQTDNLEDILSEVRQAKMVTHVSCNHRFSSRIKTVDAILRRGDIGVPLTGLVEIGEWLPDWHPYEPYTDYYPAHKSMGGGIDAICDLDWMIMLFGKVSRTVSLCSKRSDLNIDTADVAQFIVEFERGPQLMLHTDMLQRTYHQQLRIVGSEGTLMHNHPNTFINLYAKTTDSWSTIPFLDTECDDNPLRGNIPGKEWQSYVEPMYLADSLDFLERLKSGDHSTKSLEAGIYNLKLIKSLIP